MAEEHRCQAPQLCANNCGFFGSPTTQNLCSKCYRDLQLKEQQSSSAKQAFNHTFVPSSSSLPSSSSARSSFSASLPVEDEPSAGTKETKVVEGEEVQVTPNRCLSCKKRVGLTGFKCRCGMVFCGIHRYPEQHACTFDFKGMGKQQIAKANPLVKGEAKSKLEIKQLLERDFPSQGRQRNFATSRSFSHHDAKSKNSNGLPVLLRSPKFYRYWLDFRRNLQLWARKKTFQSDIMMDLVSLVKTPIDRHNGLMSSARKYKSCAVVGNSGILLNRDYGELIDGHEIVIRLNNARTEKFEENVGSKTSISFVNSNILHLCARREGCFCHPYGRNVPMIMYICQPVHFMDYTVCNSSHKAPLLITDPRFDVLCARIVKYYSAKRFVEETRKALGEWASTHDGSMFHYSSGMQAVMLALGICDKVSIFGFGKSTSAKHHYHTNQKSELRLHDYKAEYAFYHDLLKNPQAIPFISDRFRFPPVVIYL